MWFISTLQQGPSTFDPQHTTATHGLDDVIAFYNIAHILIIKRVDLLTEMQPHLHVRQGSLMQMPEVFGPVHITPCWRWIRCSWAHTSYSVIAYWPPFHRWRTELGSFTAVSCFFAAQCVCVYNVRKRRSVNVSLHFWNNSFLMDDTCYGLSYISFSFNMTQKVNFKRFVDIT